MSTEGTPKSPSTDAAKEQALNVPEHVKLRIIYIREALKAGRKVMLGGRQVTSIDVVPSKRSVIIIVNGTETMYPSRFMSLKLEVI